MNDATPQCATPRYDSWRPWSGAGRWSWLPPGPGPALTASALNAWSAATLTDALRALGPVARPGLVSIDGPPEAPLNVGELRIAALEELTPVIAPIVTPVQTVDVDLDLSVWFTAEGDAQVARHWLRRGAALWAFLRGDSPAFTLVVDHTLFIDGNLNGDSNHELFLKNQPILAGMIAALSGRLGPVAEFEGLPSVTAAGYAPDDGEY